MTAFLRLQCVLWFAYCLLPTTMSQSQSQSQSQSSRSPLRRNMRSNSDSDSHSDTREVDNVFLRTAFKIASTGFDDDSKTKNKNTNTGVVAIDKTASVIAAIAESKALYESLKIEYIAAGCVETWSPFPTPDSVSTEVTIDMQTMDKRKVCTCGLIHDMAASRVLSTEEEKFASSLVDGTTKFDDVATSASKAVSESKDRASMTKLDSWVTARTANSRTKCVNKKAGDFACQNIDLVSHMPLNSFKTTNTNQAPSGANDVWGWTSRDGNDREFVIWGVKEGHYFVEVFKDDSDPFVAGFLPQTPGNGYAWQHDAKVVGDNVYIGAESGNHGIQIFDLTRLLDINSNSDCDDNSSGYCKNLSPDALYTGPEGENRVGNTHNIVANDENPDYVYLVGGSQCYGGLHIVDVSNPKDPQFVTCFDDDGYTHDAQCVNYKGPDTRFSGREICFCYNEDSITIVDVTNKSNPSAVSKTGYQKSRYTHQGWISSEHTHIVFGDEVDELEAGFTKTRTMVLNVEDLTDTNNFQEFLGPTGAIDHNQYVVKATAEGQFPNADVRYRNTDLIYQANYAAGLGILQVLEYETANFEEIAYFDTYPSNNNAEFEGAWSSYPYFKSGVIAISSISEGLFLVRPDLEAALVEIDPIPDPIVTPPSPPLSAPPPPQTCQTHVFQVRTDAYPGDNSWKITGTDENQNSVEFTSPTYDTPNKLFEDEICLPQGAFDLKFYDAYEEDGMGDGYYRILDSCGNVIVDSGNLEETFTEKTHEFTIDGLGCSPPTTDEPEQVTECKNTTKKKFRLGKGGKKWNCKKHASKDLCDKRIAKKRVPKKYRNKLVSEICPYSCGAC